MGVASKMYCRSLGARLNAAGGIYAYFERTDLSLILLFSSLLIAGLQYEDLLLETTDVKKAVSRLSHDVGVDRYWRRVSISF